MVAGRTRSDRCRPAPRRSRPIRSSSSNSSSSGRSRRASYPRGRAPCWTVIAGPSGGIGHGEVRGASPLTVLPELSTDASVPQVSSAATRGQASPGAAGLGHTGEGRAPTASALPEHGFTASVAGYGAPMSLNAVLSRLVDRSTNAVERAAALDAPSEAIDSVVSRIPDGPVKDLLSRRRGRPSAAPGPGRGPDRRVHRRRGPRPDRPGAVGCPHPGRARPAQQRPGGRGRTRRTGATRAAPNGGWDWPISPSTWQVSASSRRPGCRAAGTPGPESSTAMAPGSR